MLSAIKEYTEYKLYIFSFFLMCPQNIKDKFHVKSKWNLSYNLCVLLCLKKNWLWQGILAISGAFLMSENNSGFNLLGI